MTDAWVTALRAALGDRVHTQPAELAAVARDASHVIGRPQALLYPETSEHVATAVRIAREHGVPVIARGGGTSLTGATVPTRGGLVIAFNRMKAILDLDVEERTALVQPGLPNAVLDREARLHGLRFTPDPSSRAASVIGGNIAHERRRAALPRPRRHGRPRARHRGRVRRRHDRVARGHRRQRPARARDRERGHARDRHVRARAPAADARAPGRGRGGLPPARAVPAPAPSAWCSRRPGWWPASSSTRPCCARSTTWRRACCRRTSRRRC